MSGTTPTEQFSGSVLTRLLGWIDGLPVSLCLASLVVIVTGGSVQVSFSVSSMTIVEAWRAVFDSTVILDPWIWQVFLLDGEFPELNRRTLIVWNVRLPRVFIVILVGTNLAISDATFQVITRNELASPLILGISSGAGLLILLTLVVFSGLVAYLPSLAVPDGMLAFILIYLIAWKNSTSPARLVLAGVVVGTASQSLQAGLSSFVNGIDVVQSAIAWTTGSLTGIDWEQVHMTLPRSIIAVGLTLESSRQLNASLLGEQTVRPFGVSIEKVRFALPGVAVLAAATSIAATGITDLVDLIIPYLVWNVVGNDCKCLVVDCLLTDPTLMVVAGVGARLALNLIQLSVGVVTGPASGSYFLYLIRKQQNISKV